MICKTYKLVKLKSNIHFLINQQMRKKPIFTESKVEI